MVLELQKQFLLLACVLHLIGYETLRFVGLAGTVPDSSRSWPRGGDRLILPRYYTFR
jgi:hypothetical protein